MNATTGKHRLFIAAVLLAVLLSGQLVYAQDDRRHCATQVPQWVIDRQEYETTYVWHAPVLEMVDAAGMDDIPQWVLDRQQYETTFVYAPPATQVQASSAGMGIPQWVVDRQQYETTYVYMPPAEPVVLVYNDCAVVQAGDF